MAVNTEDLQTIEDLQTGAPAASRKRLKSRDPIHADILDFLTDELVLLDTDQHEEWLQILAPDIIYSIPQRKTRHKRDGDPFDSKGNLFSDTKRNLEVRVQRSVVIRSAFDRDPPPRIRRFMSNLIVYETELPHVFEAESYILLLRSQSDDPNWDIMCGRREDIVRETPDGFRLARRTVFLDQAALGALFLNVFM